MPSDRAGTISICDDKPKPSIGKITICDDKPKPSDGKIVICPPECGPEITDLTIFGDTAPSIGSSYGATGGKPPYRYSISAGTIDHTTGTVTDLSGACGTGSVSVSDACGNAASMQVAFLNGQWVYTGEDVWGNPCNVDEVEQGGIMVPTYSYSTNNCIKQVSAFQRINYIWVNYNTQPYTAPECWRGNCFDHDPCTGAYMAPYGCTVTSIGRFPYRAYVQAWVCP
jgi:hypothetical protein